MIFERIWICFIRQSLILPLKQTNMMFVEFELKPNLLSSQEWDEIHIVSLCNSTDAGGAPCALCSLTRICKRPPQQGDYLETDKAAAAETANMVWNFENHAIFYLWLFILYRVLRVYFLHYKNIKEVVFSWPHITSKGFPLNYNGTLISFKHWIQSLNLILSDYSSLHTILCYIDIQSDLVDIEMKIRSRAI